MPFHVGIIQGAPTAIQSAVEQTKVIRRQGLQKKKEKERKEGRWGLMTVREVG